MNKLENKFRCFFYALKGFRELREVILMFLFFLVHANYERVFNPFSVISIPQNSE